MALRIISVSLLDGSCALGLLSIIMKLSVSFSLAGALLLPGEGEGFDDDAGFSLPQALRTSAAAIESAVICFKRVFNTMTSLNKRKKIMDEVEYALTW
jgi:hypothetical protein